MSESEDCMSQLRAELHIAQPYFNAAANNNHSIETKVAMLQKRVTLVEQQLHILVSNTDATTQTDATTGQ
mgnify:CR=1 FL=1